MILEEGRVLAVWGAGINGRKFIEHYKKHIGIVIDNDPVKHGKKLEDIPIVHISKICDIKRYFIVIAVANSNPIERQLEMLGLKKGKILAQTMNMHHKLYP